MLRLSQIDTNLLVALDVLLEELHVTRSARRLGVTQSAMSQTLRRLRDALDDALLVRSGSGMVATPRAEALRPGLRAALRALEDSLNAVEAFDPAVVERAFELAALDVYGVSLVPRLVDALTTAGDGLTLRVASLRSGQAWEQLRTGEAELAIVAASSDHPGDIGTAHILSERMVGLVRSGHPLLSEPVTIERYCAWPHLAFRLTGHGEHAVDVRLRERGHARRVVCYTPSFLSAPSVLVSTDAIALLPRSVACHYALHWPVRVFEPPIDPIEFDVAMAWPRVFDDEPGHRWFRSQVAQAATGWEAAASQCSIVSCDAASQ